MVKKKKKNNNRALSIIFVIALLSGFAGLGYLYTWIQGDLHYFFSHGFAGVVGMILTILFYGKKK